MSEIYKSITILNITNTEDTAHPNNVVIILKGDISEVEMSGENIGVGGGFSI